MPCSCLVLQNATFYRKVGKVDVVYAMWLRAMAMATIYTHTDIETEHQVAASQVTFWTSNHDECLLSAINPNRQFETKTI